MAKVEKLDEGLKRSEWKATTGSGTSTPPEVKTTFLQSFLTRLKLFGLIKQQNPDFRLTEKELKDLDEKLDSPVEAEQQGAIERVEELFKVKEAASAELATTKMEDVVDGAKLSKQKKVDLKAKAARVDLLLISGGASLTSTELEEAYANLQELREGLGSENLGLLVERPEGFTYVEDQLEKLGERRKIADFKVDNGGEFRINPLEEAADQFDDVTKSGDLLQIRVGWQPTLVPKLKEFRRRVREELIEPTGRAKLDVMSGDVVLERIKEVSEWRGRMHELYGDKWVGSKHQDEIRNLLFKIEAGYQDELARKIAENFKNRKLGNDLQGFVGSATAQVLEKNYRARGKSQYQFGGADNFVKIAGEVRKAAEEIKGRVGVVEGRSMGGIKITPEMEEMYMGGMEQSKKAKRFGNQVSKLDSLLTGTEYTIDRQFFEDLSGDDGVRVVLDGMRRAGVNVGDPETQAIVNSVRESYLANEDGFGDIQKDLGELLDDGDYADAINRVMEFIGRVGLKEVSSDWKLAVILRELNDRISRVNPDLKEGFEARQHLRFLPSINSVMPEKFGEISSQVMAKSNVDLGLSPDKAFLMGAQITVGDGQKMNVSTAMFKDVLRSEKNSMKLLDADINTTDSTLEGIFIEHVWGKGAKVSSDGSKIELSNGQSVLMDSKVKMEFFDIDVKHVGRGYGEPDGKSREVTVRQMLNRTHWMLQDAQQFWWYGREWEKYLANYPKEQMESAPKGLAAAGRMWGAYKSEFEQIARTMEDVGILGAMLQPNEVYKINDAIAMNVREQMIARAEKDERWNRDPAWRDKQGELADKTGKFFAKVMGNRMVLEADSDKYEFLVDTVSREEMRLIGNNIDTNNFDEVWKVTRERFLDLGMSESDIPDARLAKTLSAKWDGTKKKTTIEDEQTRFWGKQVEEMRKLINARKFDAEDMKIVGTLNANGLRDLLPILHNQELVHGRPITATNMSELFQQLEFSTILNWAKSNQGDDPFQIGGKYYQKSIEAGNILTKICNLMGTNDDMVKLHELMSGYVPAPDLRKFEIILNHRLLRSRTNQIVPYEVVALKKGAESPNAFDFVTMVDSKKRKWQVKGQYGERGTVKDQYVGNFGWREKGQWGWRDSDVEQRTRWLNGVGYLTKEKAEKMYEQVTGINREVRWVFDKLGLKGPVAKKVEHFIGHWGSKIKGILKKHPLFDDPVWAFWNITNELVEYTKEVGKEMGKELTH